MVRPGIAEGFKFWRDEVEGLGQAENSEPYIPVIALAGIYAATRHDRPLTSYEWRRTVLQNEDAFMALKRSLTHFSRDELDEVFELPLDQLELDEDASMQHQFMHYSVRDGLPDGVKTIPMNELFLAHTLGRAAHDHSVAFEPLRLYDQGPVALRNFYPQTAALIAEIL